MTRMNWEKVRRESLCMTHGTESIVEDVAPNGDLGGQTSGPHRGTITVGNPVAGMKLSGHSRENNSLGTTIPTTMAILRVLPTVYDENALETLSDADLIEGREICDSLNRRLREMQFQRKRQNPYR